MSVVFSIILGLVGLGIVVFIHEFGHFLAARALGIGVETFSLGWGPRLIGFKSGETDYRISAFPIGGYCLLKGEAAFRKALEEKLDNIPKDPGTFYGASPWRRLGVSLAGPVANVVFALVVFIFVASAGYSVQTHGNKIVLASEYPLDSKAVSNKYPADRGGLQSGDIILAAGGKEVRDYYDIQNAISENTPGGRIGVFAWIEPLVKAVDPGSAASLAGILPGDLIVAVDGKPVEHAISLLSALKNRPERVKFGIARGKSQVEVNLVLSWNEGGTSNLGLGFATQPHTVRSPTFPLAFINGISETGDTVSLTLRSLGALIHRPQERDLMLKVDRGDSLVNVAVRPSLEGVDLFSSISGPARITWIVGSTASQGFGEQGTSGLIKSLNLLAFLSIGLFIMNLLPIPALDGGQMLLFAFEGIRNRPLKTKNVYRFQFVGAAIVLALFVLASVGDLIFFSR